VFQSRVSTLGFNLGFYSLTIKTMAPAPKLVKLGAFGTSGDDKVLNQESVFTVSGPKEDAWAVSPSDTFVLLTHGSACLHMEDGAVLTVRGGEGVLLPRDAKTRWVWTEKCTGISLCVPALWLRLRGLHEEASHEWLYHCAPRAQWEAAVSGKAPFYFPETFNLDGKFVHATADPAVLLFVLNHFYKSSVGDWVCLRMSTASLLQHGIETVFEPAAPVGNTPTSSDISSSKLFPHILGGIPPAAVLEVTPVMRESDGTFIEVAGVTATNGGNSFTESLLARFRTSSFAAGLVFGAAGGALLAFAAARRTRP
jgi:uncharacterized protein (DUF952 family)